MHTLTVTDQGISVRAEGDSLVLCRGEHAVRRERVRELEQVLLVGRVELTSGAVFLLLRRGVDVVWLTQRGDFRGRLASRSSNNVALRLAQYRRSTDEAFCRQIAAALVAGKIRQQRQVLLRAQRRLRDDPLAAAVGQLRTLLGRVETEPSLDRIRGFEGQAAAVYFGQFGKLLRNDQFQFPRRSRRPPRDEINALLSFGYAVLGSIMETEMYRCGLDPMLGFFHQPSFGRASLMLDLLEEFRPTIDLLVLRVVNRRQLSPSDFEHRTGQELAELLSDDALPARGIPDEADALPDVPVPGEAVSQDAASETAANTTTHGESSPSVAEVGVYLGDVGRRIYLNELFGRLRERVFYPPRAMRLELRDVVRQQIYLLARVIEGKAESYQPFSWE